MEKSLIIAGFGGQGVMVCGQLIGYTVSDTTDDYVTFFPTYGAEQRGGTANCYVVISDQEIGSPMSDEADYAMILNNPSLIKFQGRVKPEGTIFMDSSVVSIDTDRKDVNVIKVPAGEIAIELGNTKVANLVMVGAFVGYTSILPPEKVLATAFKKLGAKRPQLNPLNEAAFNRGLEIGKAAVK